MWLVNYCSRVPCGARPGMKKSLLLCWFSVLTIEVRTQDQVGEHLQAAVWAHPTPDTVRVNRLLAMGQWERRSCRPWPLSRKPPAGPAGSAAPAGRPTRRWAWAFITGSATSTGLFWRIRSRPGSVLCGPATASAKRGACIICLSPCTGRASLPKSWPIVSMACIQPRKYTTSSRSGL